MGAKVGGGRSFDMFLKSVRHPLGNMEQAPGYSYLKFGERSWLEIETRELSVHHKD